MRVVCVYIVVGVLSCIEFCWMLEELGNGNSLFHGVNKDFEI